MQKMNKKTWIAVTVAISVVGFFMFGGDIIGFFQGKDTTQVASTENATNFMPQSVVVQDVVTGTGDEVVNGALLSVHYVGMLSDGKVFDSSLARRQPFEFIYGGGQVISGLEQGMAGMKVGGKRRIVIPPSLGYGDKDAGPIPANSTIIFDIELLKVTKPTGSIQR